MTIKQNDPGILGELKSDQASKPVCPVCGCTTSGQLLCDVDSFLIYSCNYCGVEFVSPQPDDATLKVYYNRKDWFEGGEKGGYQDYDAQTAWSVSLVGSVLEDYEDQKGLSILDVGCGYGTHLAMAAERGWKCFGVELSDHARAVAKSRLGYAAYVVESTSDLIPHEFDLILMLDVIEHLYSPYILFYGLFSIGAITPKTRIVITTPNAGSIAACSDPEKWAYRHPPSHLMFYNAESLSYLLKRLMFTEVEIQGLHPIASSVPPGELENFDGLLVHASGSDFAEFMHERYVPGTWSQIATYEHMPRYALARTLAVDKQVLDFGCGTGYGAAMLAEVAGKVIGLDIDDNALKWAGEFHRNPRLKFHQCCDFGAALEPASFDLVTCFEMIEHVNYDMQRATITSIARLLRDDGVLLISTPNPEITKLYGENPFHLREMTEGEFLALLSEKFAHVALLNQKVRTCISFGDSVDGEVFHSVNINPNHCTSCSSPLAFIAACSKVKEVKIPSSISFDDSNYILDYMRREEKLHQARFEAYVLSERLHAITSELANNQKRSKELAAEFEIDQQRAKELTSFYSLVKQMVSLLFARLRGVFSGKR